MVATNKKTINFILLNIRITKQTHPNPNPNPNPKAAQMVDTSKRAITGEGSIPNPNSDRKPGTCISQ